MADVEWYIAQNGNTEGPVTQAELENLIRSGILKHSDLVWKDGFADWVQAGTLPGLFKSPPVPPQLSVNQTLSGNRIHSAQVDVISNRKMLSQLRDDVEDLLLFVAEMIRVAVRVNPVNLQVFNFLGIIDQITEHTPPYEIARLVSEAMHQIELNNAASMLDESLDFISEIGPELITKGCADIIQVGPQLKQFLKHRWLDNPEAEGEYMRQQLKSAVQSQRHDLIVIQDHFRQLQEFHPRFDSILRRTGVFDYVLGFTVGFLGGGLGFVGAQIWEDWRNKSDYEFRQLFANAVNQFSDAALSFTQKTEQEVEKVIAVFLQDVHSFYHGINNALEEIVDTQDITPIYQKLHLPDPADRIDDDGREFLEIVISNLRDQNISARSEFNIREMLGVH
jgi:hypothetical protein